MVDGFTIALRLTDGEVQAAVVKIRLRGVDVIKSICTKARCGTQHRLRVPL